MLTGRDPAQELSDSLLVSYWASISTVEHAQTPLNKSVESHAITTQKRCSIYSTASCELLNKLIRNY